MTFNALSRTTLTGIGVVTAAVALPSAVFAQELPPLPSPMSVEEVQTLPPELRKGPVTQTASRPVAQGVTETTETVVGADGVETITRTRRIESAAPYATPYTGQPGEYQWTEQQAPQAYDGYGYDYAPAYGYAPAAQVFSREDWIAECEDRTNGRGDGEKGGIIGGLLGAITGGIIGNRVAGAGDRLGGTLIGAGVGGLGGLLLGSLIGGGRNDRGEYDCEAALDSYLSQYGRPGTRIAARSIPAPIYAAPAAYPAYAPPAYGYGYPAYGYSYNYAPPQQIVYVPVEYQQQQRVIVRETVREEVIPGARRIIPAPAPQPVPVPRQEPRPIKGEPRYIKGY